MVKPPAQLSQKSFNLTQIPIAGSRQYVRELIDCGFSEIAPAPGELARLVGPAGEIIALRTQYIYPSWQIGLSVEGAPECELGRLQLIAVLGAELAEVQP